MALKLGGLATGLDTNTIIEELMRLERIPVTRMELRQKGYQEKMEAWQDVRMRVYNLQNEADNLLTPGVFDSRRVNSTLESVAGGKATAVAEPANYQLDIHSYAKAHTVMSQAFSGLGSSGVIQINGVDIALEASYGLVQVRDAINAAGTGVEAYIIEDTLVLQSEETGVAGKISVEDGDGLLESLGFGETNGGEWRWFNLVEDGHQAVYREAEDASFNLNGVPVKRSSNEVDDLVPGVTFYIYDVGHTTLTVAPDTAGAVEKVQAFVDQFNSTYSFIQDKSRVKVDGDKVEREILQGDSLMMSLDRQLRLALSSIYPVNFLYNSLASVGVSVDRSGYMTLDQEKLGAALLRDPDEVQALFAGEARSMPGQVRGRTELQGLDAQTGGTLTLVLDRPGDGSSPGEEYQVFFDPGTEYNPLQVVQAINNQVGKKVASLSPTGQLVLTSTTTNEHLPSSVRVDSISDPALASALGLSPGQSGSRTTAPEGLARGLGRLLEDYTVSGVGRFARKTATLQRLSDDIDKRIEILEYRLEMRLANLERTFTALESYMSEQNSMASWLTQQLGNLPGFNYQKGD